MSSIPARMKKIKLKMKAVDCSQDFSHYKPMGIFPDAQGQLTPQSLVRSGRISNSSEILWMSSLPASMKKIRSKMKTLEWTQHFPHYNSMVAMETSGRIWPNFELIQALIHVLKYEKNPIKNYGTPKLSDDATKSYYDVITLLYDVITLLYVVITLLYDVITLLYDVIT